MMPEKATLVKAPNTDTKQKLSDILVAISWRDIARTYFGKSSSWLYHKLDGIDGNGGVGGSSSRERFATFPTEFAAPLTPFKSIC